jgi:hypothetical protein
MLIISCFCIYNIIIIILSVAKLAIATGHAMQVFNELHHSNKCKFVSIEWPVAMASLHWIQCNVYIKILSQFLFQLSFYCHLQGYPNQRTTKQTDDGETKSICWHFHLISVNIIFCLWKHHVNLLLQTLCGVSTNKILYLLTAEKFVAHAPDFHWNLKISPKK